MKAEDTSIRHLPLPWFVNCIKDVAGIDAALTLCLEKGGQRILIPMHPEGSELEKIVGQEAAHKIAAKFGNERMGVPIARKPLVFWLRDKGLSQERIAGRLHMSRRSVQYLLSDNMPRRRDTETSEERG